MRQSDVRFRFSVPECAALDVVRFELEEGVSQSFRLELELSSFDHAIDPNALLDRDATFTIERDGIAERTVVGIITAFECGETGFQRTRYRALIESPLARLALRHNSRIFQQINAPEILATLLKEHRLLGAQTTYVGNHEPREYAVQYREHDDQFLHRLATEEGIVYWHQTEGSQCRLVLSDRIDTAPTLDGAVLYQPAPAGDAPTPHLWHFSHRRQLAPTRATSRDYTFKNPRYDLEHQAKAWAAENAVGDYENYDYAGRYKRDEAGKPFTRTRLAGLRNAAETARIEGDDARLWPGLAFDLTGHPHAKLNDRWRVVSLRHTGQQAASQENGTTASPEEGVQSDDAPKFVVRDLALPVTGIPLYEVTSKFGAPEKIVASPYTCDSAFDTEAVKLYVYPNLEIETDGKLAIPRVLRVGTDARVVSGGSDLSAKTEVHFKEVTGTEVMDDHSYRMSLTPDGDLDSSLDFQFVSGHLESVRYWIGC